MRRAFAILSSAALAAGGCSATGTSATDAGTTPAEDAGGCGEACAIPDGGECLARLASCAGSGLCCPGLRCIDGGCQNPLNPCLGLNGEQLLPSGCGCDPTLGADAGCDPGFVCDAQLQCVVDAGVPIELIDQPVGAPCDPLVTYPDGGPAPPCAEPVRDLEDAGAFLNSVDCVADPSGTYLYVCAQACSSNRDCPLAWQSCGSAFASGGYCGDTPCTSVPASNPQSFFAPCPDGGGLCLPFNALVLATLGDGGVASSVESYGLCLQASPDAGPNAVCSDPPNRNGLLCDAQQLCALGRCRSPCNAAPDAGLPDAGSCLAGEVCLPLGIQPAVPGAAWAAGGCVSSCELDGGECDAGVRGGDAGMDAGVDAGVDAGPDGGVDAGARDGGVDGGNDGGEGSDGGDGG